MVTLFGGYLMKIYAWKTMLGGDGAINSALMTLGLIDQPIRVLFYSPLAVIITLTHFLLPFAILPITAALRGITDAEIESARDLGARGFEVMKDIIVPRARAGIMAGFALCFLISVGDYLTPMLVGGTMAMVGQLIAPQFGTYFNWPLGSAMSFSILSVSLVILGIVYAALSRVGPAMKWGAVAHRIAGAVIVAVLLSPLVLVVLFAFTTKAVSNFPITGLTLRWWREMLAFEPFPTALYNSLTIGLSVGLLAAIIGTMAALGLACLPARRAQLAMAVLALPLMLPPLFIAVMLLVWYLFLQLPLGLSTVVLSHLLFTLPFVVIVVYARLSSFDFRTVEAARDLGASPLRAFVDITLPIIRPDGDRRRLDGDRALHRRFHPHQLHHRRRQYPADPRHEHAAPQRDADDQRDRHHADRIEHRVDAHRPLSDPLSRMTGG